MFGQSLVRRKFGSPKFYWNRLWRCGSPVHVSACFLSAECTLKFTFVHMGISILRIISCRSTRDRQAVTNFVVTERVKQQWSLMIFHFLTIVLNTGIDWLTDRCAPALFTLTDLAGKHSNEPNIVQHMCLWHFLRLVPLKPLLSFQSVRVSNCCSREAGQDPGKAP